MYYYVVHGEKYYLTVEALITVHRCIEKLTEKYFQITTVVTNK